MVESLVLSLFFTEIIELTIAVLFGVRKRIDIFIVILANIVTNLPIVFIMNMLMGNVSKVLYFGIMFVLEIFVFLIEGFIYYRLKVESKFGPYKLSFILNLVTTAIGVVLHVIKM